MPLVTSKEMFEKAYNGGYAIGAFNVNNMEIIQGITEAAAELKAPLILQVSKGARAYANRTYLKKLVEAAVIETGLPIVLHLDHGDSFELCKSCIEDGFTSVMIDASSKPFAENIALTRQVVEYAHDHGVVVEAELGTLAGIEDEVNVSAEDSSYTRPEEVEEFVSKTGCDSLAIAIGTSHGAYKFKPGTKPQLRFDVLEEVSRRLPGFPIVLHGSSSVPQDLVAKVNQYGGNMPGAIGVPEDQLRKAASLSVCKINIDSDLRLAMTASIREHFALHPADFDPRQFVSKTGCDSLAIAIGTSHGAYKFKPGTKPQLRFDVLEEVSRRLPGFPIVLHGSSSVPQDLVAKVNQYGGNMPGAIGVPEDQLRKAASLSVCKINIDSDLRLAMTASIREHFALHPADFDPRQYLKPARQAIKELVTHKIVDVLGCDGKAF